MTKQPTSKAGEMDWEDVDFRFKNSFMPIKANYVGAPEDITEPILDFIHEAIQQAIAQERERIAKDVKKMKWKNTPKTMLTSYHNGSIGYHKGDGVHIPHTIGSHEDMQHSHYNEAVEDVINIITNNHEDHKE